jgi:DNA (cytosine-5)-methyltransferase 1
MKEPAPVATAQGWHVAEVRSFLVKYYSAAQHGQSLKEPLHAATAKPRFGIVYVHGEPYEIVDIGMRMLTPRELYRAQGFPESYVIAPWMENRRGKNGQKLKPGYLPATSQVRMVGNSVCPPVAASLIRANVGVHCQYARAA